MSDHNNWWDWIGTDAGKAAIAGAAGGIVRWLTLRQNPKEALASLVVGSICAIWLGPLVAPIIEPVIGQISPDGDADGFASFMVGLGGISIASFVIDVFQNRLPGGKDDNQG
jgi:hypothetical protein